MNTFNLGTNIQRYRLKLNMSTNALAATAGIDIEKIRKLERGEFKKPNLNDIQKIATVLGVDLDILFMDYLNVYQHADTENELDHELLNLFYTLPFNKQEYILGQINFWLRSLDEHSITPRSIYASEIEWILSQSTPEEQEKLYALIRQFTF